MLRWSVRVGLSALVAVALGLPAARPAEAATDAPSAAAVVSWINSARQSRGLSPLSVDATLTAVAQHWTDSIAAAGALAHNPDLSSQAPAGWAALGENVGMGPSVDVVDNAFWNSAAHQANVLGDFDAVGVGVDLSNGSVWVTVDFLKWGPRPPVAVAASSPAPSPASPPGYYVLGSDGGIFTYGGAAFLGSVPGLGVAARAVLMAVTPTHRGYWVLGSDGGVFSFGDARFFGSAPGAGARVNAVDLKPTRSGNGYWVLGSDGSVFAFGDAGSFGSLPGAGVHDQAIRLVPTLTGNGYWILGADGGIFSFGDARFFGSLPGVGVRERPISMAPSAAGYWILGADGGIFSFGDARFFGSVPGLAVPNPGTGVQLAPTADGQGYDVLTNTGRVFAFGDGPALGDPSALGVSALDLALVP